ncbi:MAG: hypothetical protein KDC57_17050 [Saprospiraceae bacterium]|nr:hypothetical protein [Saprospiraceae bacterium]
MISLEVKYQSCNLCDAMHRNINDNFKSISFEVLSTGEIQIKFTLDKITDRELEYIDDIITEFEAQQDWNCVLKPIIEFGDCHPLVNLVYLK